MNARELFNWHGGSTGVFYCTQCRTTHRTEESAERCCAPLVCACGAVIPKDRHRTICRPCEERKYKDKEQAAFEAAEKIPEFLYDGWVYEDGEYYQSIEEWRTRFEEEVRFSEEEETPLPDYVWACDANRVVSVSIGSILGNISDNAQLEDFDAGTECAGIKELEAALEAFNSANAGLVSYSRNPKRAVLIDKDNPRKVLRQLPSCGGRLRFVMLQVDGRGEVTRLWEAERPADTGPEPGFIEQADEFIGLPDNQQTSD